MSKGLAYLLTALLAGALGYASYALLRPDQPQAATPSTAVDLGGEPLVGRPRPDYSLGRTDGAIVTAADFDGQVVLVNFWATWCAPCREEMPMLSELRQAYLGDGFEVVGIALDEVQAARDFVEELGIQYPNLVGSTDVMAAIRLYGNSTGALPYSVLIDRDGIIRWTRMGVLHRDTLEPEIRALLEES